MDVPCLPAGPREPAGRSRRPLSHAPLPFYTHPIAITLDAAIEQRIQQQLGHGAFREPTELLALDLVEAEATQEDWPLRKSIPAHPDLASSI